MNSNNPFRNPYTPVAPSPPPYESSVSPYNSKGSDEKSRSEDEKSHEPFAHEGSHNQDLPAYERDQSRLGGPPSTSGYNPTYLPDGSVSGTHDVTGIQDNHSQMPPQHESGQNRGLFSWMVGNNPLEPLPAQFRRISPPNYSYDMFSPMTLIGTTHSLRDGWIVMSPPAPPGMDHPFMTHDVRQEDWAKFLQDLNQTARWGTINAFRSRGVPRSLTLQRRMYRKNVVPLGEIIDAWNNYYFHPRRMSVVLAQGRRRCSGLIDDYPPDVGRHRDLDERGIARRHRSSSPLSCSSSDYDSDHWTRSEHEHHHHEHFEAHGHHQHEEHGNGVSSFLSPIRDGRMGILSTVHELRRAKSQVLGGPRRFRRELRAEIREPRRELRAEIRGSRRELRHGSIEEKWRLVVCFFDGGREVF